MDGGIQDRSRCTSQGEQLILASLCVQHCFLQQGSAKNKQVSREEGVKAAGSMGRCQY